VTFHIPFNFSLTGVNLRQVNIITTLSAFDQAPSLAVKFLRYRVRSLKWRFYCNASIPFQQGANTIFPLRVYEVPMVSRKVPSIAISSYLGYSKSKDYTFTSDIVGSNVPYSPIEGTL